MWKDSKEKGNYWKKGTIKGEKRKQGGWLKARERNVIRKLTALLSRHNARINISLTVVQQIPAHRGWILNMTSPLSYYSHTLFFSHVSPIIWTCLHICDPSRVCMLVSWQGSCQEPIYIAPGAQTLWKSWEQRRRRKKSVRVRWMGPK